jgi:hypothetical protein
MRSAMIPMLAASERIPCMSTTGLYAFISVIKRRKFKVFEIARKFIVYKNLH